jgi:DNA adenine methylase
MKACIICGRELTGRQRKLCDSSECQNQHSATKQMKHRQKVARANRNETALQLNAKKLKISSPPIRYFGGKWRIASWIMQQFPPHTTYVEPFCGGASILFRKQPSKIEVVNDLNSDIINFFDVLRSYPEKLLQAIQLTPYSREEHRRAHLPAPETDIVERARRFYIRSRQSFGSGEGEYSTGWRYQANTKRGTSCIDEWNSIEHLWNAAERLKAVQIECDDALKCIGRFDTPDTLYYVDPPYLFETRHSDEHRYAHELTNQQHIELADVLKAVQGMVLISGYESPLYDELYAGWRRVEKHTRTNGGHDAMEYLWISPKADDLNRLPLFQMVGDL